jgi:hypothetical protein
MSTTIKVAQVEGGAGGDGLFVDMNTSATLSDTRIRAYGYACSAVCSIIVGDQDGPQIKQPVLAGNTVDTIYMIDMGIKVRGNVSVSGTASAGKIYLYYG